MHMLCTLNFKMLNNVHIRRVDENYYITFHFIFNQNKRIKIRICKTQSFLSKNFLLLVCCNTYLKWSSVIVMWIQTSSLLLPIYYWKIITYNIQKLILTKNTLFSRIINQRSVIEYHREGAQPLQLNGTTYYYFICCIKIFMKQSSHIQLQVLH